MKKLLSLVLATALCFSLAAPALAVDLSEETFPSVNEYVGYADVAETDWFYENAKLCYEVGLMEGSNIGFEPYATMTTAQVFAITARMAESILGYSLPTDDGSDTWYAPYVTFLTAMGIPVPEDIEAPISRYDFITLLAAVIPEEYLSPINSITTLPDTSDANVLAFYNAGILTGMDDYGTFMGDKTLTRAEASAMLSRIVREELRISFTPAVAETVTDDLAMTLLGYSGDSIFFTDNGEVTITLEEALPNLVDIIDNLTYICALYGMEFSFYYTYSDGSSVTDDLINDAIYVSLIMGWALSLDADVALSEESLAFLAEADMDTYAQYGYTMDSLTTHTYFYTDLYPYLMAQYGDDEAFVAWQNENQLYGAKHILVEDLETAEELCAQLEADPDLFDALMAEYSIDPGSTTYPDGYFFGTGEMVASFEEATAALEIGEISAPVESSYGYHIILRLSYDIETYQYDMIDADYSAYLETVDFTTCTGLAFDGIDYGIFYNNLNTLRGY